jgi:hypothetical protein
VAVRGAAVAQAAAPHRSRQVRAHAARARLAEAIWFSISAM